MSLNKLIAIQKSLEFSFGEILRNTVEEQLRAQFAGDQVLFNELVAAEDAARIKLLEARRRVMIAELSSDNIDRLVRGLSEQSNQARALLDDLRKTKETLESVKQAAELATAIFGTVAGIV